jgi:hypothetical protein
MQRLEVSGAVRHIYIYIYIYIYMSLCGQRLITSEYTFNQIALYFKLLVLTVQ